MTPLRRNMDTATLKPLRPFRDKLFWLLGARVAHYLSVAPRQFVDAFPLAEPDCVLVDQVLPNAQRNRSRKDEIRCILLSHAS